MALYLDIFHLLFLKICFEGNVISSFAKASCRKTNQLVKGFFFCNSGSCFSSHRVSDIDYLKQGKWHVDCLLQIWKSSKEFILIRSDKVLADCQECSGIFQKWMLCSRIRKRLVEGIIGALREPGAVIAVLGLALREQSSPLGRMLPAPGLWQPEFTFHSVCLFTLTLN